MIYALDAPESWYDFKIGLVSVKNSTKSRLAVQTLRVANSADKAVPMHWVDAPPGAVFETWGPEDKIDNHVVFPALIACVRTHGRFLETGYVLFDTTHNRALARTRMTRYRKTLAKASLEDTDSVREEQQQESDFHVDAPKYDPTSLETYRSVARIRQHTEWEHMQVKGALNSLIDKLEWQIERPRRSNCSVGRWTSGLWSRPSHCAHPFSVAICTRFEQPTIAPEPWACPHCEALVQPPPTSYGAVLRFGTPDTPMEDVLWATGPQGPFCGEAGRQNGLRVVDKVCSEKLLAELYTFVSAAPDKRVTRQSDRPVYEPRFASKDIEGQVLESWYQTDAWIEAASDPTNSFWSLEGERVSLSTRQRVEDFSCLVALEKAVRDAFAEIGERQLFNVQLVQQKRQHRPYHADGPSNGGDIIIGLTISQSRMLG
eukprot:COSAG02_NODE_5312_length_4447_cov_5.535419_6_plen_429_part_01